MAHVVDQQNRNIPDYRKMPSNLGGNIALQTALELVLDGAYPASTTA